MRRCPMVRNYYKEPDTRYGRPKTKTTKQPPVFFQTYGDQTKNWDARQFLRELVQRQGNHDWEHGQERARREWKKKVRWRERDGWYEHTQEGEAPWYSSGSPITDPDEINKFLY